MSLSHRILRHGNAPRAPCHAGAPCEISQRGLVLMHIEFLLMNQHPTCIITSPLQHTRTLAYLFPHITFHVYNSPDWENSLAWGGNIRRYEHDCDGVTTRPSGLFSLIFTSETDGQQLCRALKMAAAATLFTWRELPTDHLDGQLFLPLFAGRGCTQLFMHASPFEKAREFQPLLLQEEMAAFALRSEDYDMKVQAEILTAAVRCKLAMQGDLQNDWIVGAMAKMFIF